MYHAIIPVPLELETVILQKSDPKSLFSLITTHEDIYQRSLDPLFWKPFDHYFFTECFYLAAKYNSHELYEQMLYNNFHILDLRDIEYIQTLQSEANDRIGLEITTKYLGNYDNFGNEIRSLIKKIKRNGNILEIEDIFLSLGKIYRDEYIGRSLVRLMNIDDYLWLFRNIGLKRIMPLEISKNIAGALAYYKQIDNLIKVMHLEIDRYAMVFNYQSSLDICPFFENTIQWLDYDSYIILKNIEEFNIDYYNTYFAGNIPFICDKRLFQHYIDTEIGPKIMHAGICMDPNYWWNLVLDNDEVIQTIVYGNDDDDIVDYATSYGFTYFATTIDKYRIEYYESTTK